MQFTWLVLQGPYGLIALFGDDKVFTDKLDSLFGSHNKLLGSACYYFFIGNIGFSIWFSI
ncbi:MAG: hypothetical protein DI598_20525 [Pseudopedobacter saltans]|uniref:Uncharacterized protein n=1 Tax=Pseudopedobacter saltans TaxID=151895 RepID=A0A2W5G961_9SPHI|nr:MAG: hypothetical protein DI598_20525 [Pseudopedobacter saltans]